MDFEKGKKKKKKKKILIISARKFSFPTLLE